MATRPVMRLVVRHPRHRFIRFTKRAWLVVVLVTGWVTVSASGLIGGCSQPSGDDPTQETRSGEPPRGKEWPRWGLTHTQVSADAGDHRASDSAKRLLGSSRLVQNQYIMGFGVRNPEPSPGVYNFTDLDRRIDLIRRTNGVPVITLCCSPDWMKGGEPGETDWTKIEEAPLPSHYADFARLAGVVAGRYPDVRHFMVWSELKGFFDEQRKRWDYEGYTTLYNLVYQAVKAINPESQVGGPYVVVDSHARAGRGGSVAGPWGAIDERSLDVVEYWLEHADGADFIVVDGPTTTRGGSLPTDEFSAVRKFSAVNHWIRRRTDLPLWWAEWYVEPPDSGWDEKRRTAVRAVAMMELAHGGVATALYWNPQTDGRDCPGCLWSSTFSPRGGHAMPMWAVLDFFARAFPAGTSPAPVAASPPEVRALAGAEEAIMVNTLDRPVRATVGDRPVDLGPYEVRFTAS